jgi:hypothetical protein
VKTSLCFLLAARRCEMADLQQLTETSALVRQTAALIHHLQRERGLSHLFIGSKGLRFAAEREQQIAWTDHSEAQLRACFDALGTNPPMRHGTRLFSRIAHTLHGLDTLPQMRQSVQGLALTALELFHGYTRLINCLMSVVFEAADMATDPALSRLLVALFHLMQGKELAGQERAVGSALWSAGSVAREGQQQLAHLIESQDKCLGLFEHFATPELLQLWRQCQSPQVEAERERLRRLLLQTLAGGDLDSQKSSAWFDCCSQRMDEWRLVEEQMAKMLVEHSAARWASVAEEVQAIEALKARLATAQDADLPGNAAPLFAPDPGGVATLGPALEKSVLDMLQEQSVRLQSMAAELDLVRASLNDRKRIERAKGLLMAHQQLSEEGAHKALRDLAMRQNQRMVDVADAVLSMAALFKPKA